MADVRIGFVDDDTNTALLYLTGIDDFITDEELNDLADRIFSSDYIGRVIPGPNPEISVIVVTMGRAVTIT